MRRVALKCSILKKHKSFHTKKTPGRSLPGVVTIDKRGRLYSASARSIYPLYIGKNAVSFPYFRRNIY
jgi:hypothetical protein